MEVERESSYGPNSHPAGPPPSFPLEAIPPRGGQGALEDRGRGRGIPLFSSHSFFFNFSQACAVFLRASTPIKRDVLRVCVIFE